MKPVKCVLIIADTHIGSKYAVSHPDFDLGTNTPLDTNLKKIRTDANKKIKDAMNEHLKDVGLDSYTHLLHLGDTVDCNPRVSSKIEMLPYNSDGQECLVDHAVSWISDLPITKKTQITGVLGSFSHVMSEDGIDFERKIAKELVRNGYDCQYDLERVVEIEWGRKNKYMWRIFMKHMLPKRYKTNSKLWFAEGILNEGYETEEFRKYNHTISGHWHQPFETYDSWYKQGYIVMPPLKFGGENFGRYYQSGPDHLGFWTMTFYNERDIPLFKPHSIKIISNRAPVRKG